MKYYFLWFIAAALTFCGHSAELGRPLTRAHAHNDYEHEHPLFDALAQGFCSVEADIYLQGDKLLVAHEAADLKPERTLEELYLKPLAALVQKNGGRVYPGGPTVILLVDVKTEAVATYRGLKPVLERYRAMLTRFHHQQIETNAVTIILSGNRPKEALLAEEDRLAAFDGRLADLSENYPVSFMPLVSDSFQAQFSSSKEGRLNAADSAKLEKAIKTAHQQRRQVRFWATKDDPDSWGMLLREDVDLINTDDLAGLARFLRSKH